MSPPCTSTFVFGSSCNSTTYKRIRRRMAGVVPGVCVKWWLDIDTPWGSHQMCFLVCDTQLLVPDSIAVNLAMVPVLYTVFIIMTVSITIGMNEESIVDDDGGG